MPLIYQYLFINNFFGKERGGGGELNLFYAKVHLLDDTISGNDALMPDR